MENTEMIINKTNDYSIFRKLVGNRNVYGKCKGIKKSIEKIGWMMIPVLVNEKMEIVEGQTRFEACKELGLPIYYIIQPGIGLKECRYLNYYNRVWNLQEIIDSKCIEGNDDSNKIRMLTDEFQCTTLEAINSLGIQKIGRGDFERDIVISDEDYMKARQHLIGYMKIKPFIARFHGAKRDYVAVTSYMVDHGVDMDRMAESLKIVDPEQFNASSRMAMIKSFQEAYNYNIKRRSNRIYVYESYRKGE